MSTFSNSSPSGVSPGSDKHQQQPFIQPLLSASSFNTPKKVPLFLPEEDTFMQKSSQSSPMASNTHFPDPHVDLMHISPKSTVEYSDSDSQVESQPVLAQSLTISNCQTQTAQPDTHPALIIPPLKSSASDPSDEIRRQSSHHTSHIHPRAPILSHLRHLASHSSVVGIFEEETRQLFQRERAPSPEPRPQYPSPKLSTSQEPDVEVGLWLADSGLDIRGLEDMELVNEPG
jgi:hypothetical protein